MMGTRTGRTTIDGPVTLYGRGLHSGASVRLQLSPAPPESGVVFRLNGDGETRKVPARRESIADSRNATTLASHGARVTTVEHLLAALSMAGVDDVWVDLDAAELPAVDGSAEPFIRLIATAGLRAHGGRRRFAEVLQPVVVRGDDEEISIEPAETFAVDYEIDFPATAIGNQSISFESLDRETFVREVAAARTFGFLADVERMRAAGLARGASLANTVVVDGARIVNDDGLRWPDEFVRHKVLDLVGDLALFGAPLIGRVRVRRGGHRLHHALLHALNHTPGAYRWVER